MVRSLRSVSDASTALGMPPIPAWIVAPFGMRSVIWSAMACSIGPGGLDANSTSS